MGYDFRLWTDEDLKEELLNPEIEEWFIKEILRELIKRDELLILECCLIDTNCN